MTCPGPLLGQQQDCTVSLLSCLAWVLWHKKRPLPRLAAAAPVSWATEKTFISTLIKDLNSVFFTAWTWHESGPIQIGPEASSKKSTNRQSTLYSKVNTHGWRFNAKNPPKTPTNLGTESYKLGKGRWKLTPENVETIIPDLKEIVEMFPALDNGTWVY